MASKKFEKGSPEWNLFSDYWALCQKFWEVEESNEYWKEAVNEVKAFAHKYMDIDKRFVLTLANGYLVSLQERFKESKKDV